MQRFRSLNIIIATIMLTRSHVGSRGTTTTANMRSIGRAIGLITTICCIIIIIAIAMPKRKGSSDAGVDAKRQCLDLAGLTGITTSGLEQAAHAISVIYGDPCTPKITQSSIARRWLKEYKLYGRALGLELETEDGERNGTFKWYICDLALLINFVWKRSTLLTKGFEEVCGEFGRVLQMVFYCDEVAPSNVLAPDTSRKSWGFYVSFR